jgi:hypothetical protein
MRERPIENAAMDFNARQIAPPKSWETFEDLCWALF